MDMKCVGVMGVAVGVHASRVHGVGGAECDVEPDGLLQLYDVEGGEARPPRDLRV